MSILKGGDILFLLLSLSKQLNRKLEKSSELLPGVPWKEKGCFRLI